MTTWLRLLGLESGAEVQRVIDSAWRLTQPLAPAALYLLLAVGLALAFVNFLPQLRMRTSVRLWTFLLRLAMIALLLLVLQGVEWHLELELSQRQHWLALIDDSASMATRDGADGTRFAAAIEDLEDIRDAAEDKVALSVRTFSGQALASETGHGPTLFRQALARTALARAHVDRLIILTDGRDSERRDLQRLGEDLASRGIAVGVRLYGSARPPTDAGIAAFPERAVIRLGEDLAIRGSISGGGAGKGVVTLKENGRTVKTFSPPAGAGGRFEVRYQPPKKGRHTYTLELAGADSVAQNNSVSFAADVVEEKINVLLLEGFPRFEFKIVKSVLEVDPMVSLVSLAHLPGGGAYVQGEALHRNPGQGLISSQADLFKYDVVILRDVPRSYFRVGGDTTESRLQYLVRFVTKRGGGLLVMGGQDAYRAGGYESSHLAAVLPFDLSASVSRRAQFEGRFYASVPKPAYQHPILRLLGEPNANRERLNSLRQLDGSNNVGRFKPLATPLMTRTVEVKAPGDKLVEKEAPLMAYMAVGEGKVLAASADTFWRWQLQPDFDEPPLAALLANAIRYLAPPPGRQPGRPSQGAIEGSPQVGQTLTLSTELKDRNFDPIREADLLVTVTRPDGTIGRMYPRDLPEQPGYYSYRVFLDQPGPYRVAAKYGKFESSRDLVAGVAAGEFADLSVDRDGAERLTKAAAGEIIPDLGPWLATADTQPAGKAAVRDLEAWNSPLALLLFILLVSAECYVRKRQGLA